MIMNFHSPDHEGASWLRDTNADLFRTLSVLVRQAHEKEMLTTDFSPDEVAVILLATMNGLLREWLRSGKRFGIAALGARFMRWQLALFRAVSTDQGPRTSC